MLLVWSKHFCHIKETLALHLDSHEVIRIRKVNPHLLLPTFCSNQRNVEALKCTSIAAR
jgi:hypothetical protein